MFTVICLALSSLRIKDFLALPKLSFELTDLWQSQPEWISHQIINSPLSYFFVVAVSAKLCPTHLRSDELQPTRLLCPWDSPGNNTGAGCHFLLQGIFLTQESNPHLLHWHTDSLPLNHQRSYLFGTIKIPRLPRVTIGVIF